MRNNPVIRAEKGRGYVVEHFADGQTAIFCGTCGRRSWSPRDISERFCGHCCKFHEDVQVPGG